MKSHSKVTCLINHRTLIQQIRMQTLLAKFTDSMAEFGVESVAPHQFSAKCFARMTGSSLLIYLASSYLGRLREPPGPQRANLITAFNSRKYHYPNKTGGLNSRSPSTEWNRRPQPQIQRVPTQRKPAQYGEWFTDSSSPGLFMIGC